MLLPIAFIICSPENDSRKTYFPQKISENIFGTKNSLINRFREFGHSRTVFDDRFVDKDESEKVSKKKNTLLQRCASLRRLGHKSIQPKDMLNKTKANNIEDDPENRPKHRLRSSTVTPLSRNVVGDDGFITCEIEDTKKISKPFKLSRTVVDDGSYVACDIEHLRIKENPEHFSSSLQQQDTSQFELSVSKDMETHDGYSRATNLHKKPTKTPIYRTAQSQPKTNFFNGLLNSPKRPAIAEKEFDEIIQSPRKNLLLKACKSSRRHSQDLPITDFARYTPGTISPKDYETITNRGSIEDLGYIQPHDGKFSMDKISIQDLELPCSPSCVSKKRYSSCFLSRPSGLLQSSLIKNMQQNNRVRCKSESRNTASLVTRGASYKESNDYPYKSQTIVVDRNNRERSRSKSKNRGATLKYHASDQASNEHAKKYSANQTCQCCKERDDQQLRYTAYLPMQHAHCKMPTGHVQNYSVNQVGQDRREKSGVLSKDTSNSHRHRIARHRSSRLPKESCTNQCVQKNKEKDNLQGSNLTYSPTNDMLHNNPIFNQRYPKSDFRSGKEFERTNIEPQKIKAHQRQSRYSRKKDQKPTHCAQNAILIQKYQLAQKGPKRANNCIHDPLSGSSAGLAEKINQIGIGCTRQYGGDKAFIQREKTFTGLTSYQRSKIHTDIIVCGSCQHLISFEGDKIRGGRSLLTKPATLYVSGESDDLADSIILSSIDEQSFYETPDNSNSYEQKTKDLLSESFYTKENIIKTKSLDDISTKAKEKLTDASQNLDITTCNQNGLFQVDKKPIDFFHKKTYHKIRPKIYNRSSESTTSSTETCVDYQIDSEYEVVGSESESTPLSTRRNAHSNKCKNPSIQRMTPRSNQTSFSDNEYESPYYSQIYTTSNNQSASQSTYNYEKINSTNNHSFKRRGIVFGSNLDTSYSTYLEETQSNPHKMPFKTGQSTNPSNIFQGSQNQNISKSEPRYSASEIPFRTIIPENSTNISQDSQNENIYESIYNISSINPDYKNENAFKNSRNSQENTEYIMTSAENKRLVEQAKYEISQFFNSINPPEEFNLREIKTPNIQSAMGSETKNED